MKNLALFISGGGTTATAIANACKRGVLTGLLKPRLVIAGKNGIQGIGRLLATRVVDQTDIVVLRRQDFGTSKLFGDALIAECDKRDIDVFGQYGWMVKTPANFILRYPFGINQHPCVLSPGRPDFGGRGMFGRACHLARLLFVRMTNRDFWTRAVAQRVHPEYDKGAILKQKQVKIFPDDDVDTLAKRVLPVEWRVQIQALKDFATDKPEEIPGEEIVRKHEMVAWRLAREMAILAYPKG